jgi:hypothetical protein
VPLSEIMKHIECRRAALDMLNPLHTFQEALKCLQLRQKNLLRFDDTFTIELLLAKQKVPQLLLSRFEDMVLNCFPNGIDEDVGPLQVFR